MDKVRANFVIAIAALGILSIILAGYASSLSGRLGDEKTKNMQLNDQIAGLNAKANDLQAQLTKLTVEANDQTNLVSSLQKALSASNLELENLKTAYADLESKLKAQGTAN